MVQRDLRGIERHVSAARETCRIRVRALEIIEPELLVVAAGIVFGKDQLRPAHGTVEPVWRCRVAGRIRACNGCSGHRGGTTQEIAAGCHAFNSPPRLNTVVLKTVQRKTAFSLSMMSVAVGCISQ